MTDVMQAGQSPSVEASHASSDKTYVLVAIFLAVMTALEVGASEVESDLGKFYVPAILSLMVIKFIMVAAYFMHLKNDPKMARRVFTFGIAVAVLIFSGVLSTFHFWAPGFR